MNKTGEDACKICASQSFLQHLETGSQLEAMLLNCANIEVTYPCVICTACSENIEKFYSFKEKVQNAFKRDDSVPEWSNISIDDENKENLPLNHSTPTRSSRSASFNEQTENSFGAALVCIDCGKKFQHKLLYGHHVRMHELDRRVKCASCRKSFSSSHKLKIHTRNCSKSKAKIFSVVNDRTKLLVAAAMHFANKSNEEDDKAPDEESVQEPSGYESAYSPSIIYSDASSAFDNSSIDGSIIL